MMNEWNKMIDARMAEHAVYMQAAQAELDLLDGDLHGVQVTLEADLLAALKAFHAFHQTTRRHHYCTESVLDLLIKLGVTSAELDVL